MLYLERVFESNKKWAEKVNEEDPLFFETLAKLQNPEYLWIGCSDSRVPANEIMGVKPGEVFVHRNIANMVIHTDLNCLSVIQYAIDVLKIKHIIVCGHYDCGGVNAAMDRCSHGLIDNWLRHIKDIYRIHEQELSNLKSVKERNNRLCELNIIEQVRNICDTTIVQDAWDRGQELYIHGWVYYLKDGVLKDLNVSRSSIK